MGIYRFILSCIVVLFRYGSFPRVSGYSAVFGFFLLSGYLTALMLDKGYKDIRKFWINRGLRVYPLYLFYLITMFVIVKINGGQTEFIGGTEKIRLLYLMQNQCSQLAHDFFWIL